MPIYEYECRECGDVFTEIVGTFQDYPEPSGCQSCSSSNIQRLISRPGFISTTDVSGSFEEEAQKNKAWLESPEVAAEIKTGAREMRVPKGFPPRLQPKI